jgi:polysaccharide pyruvyl transferase WcaK-like protein
VVTIEPVTTYPELIRELVPVGMVVATRYHNVMCALKLCKPTISLGYSRKFVSLMTDMGLAEFNQFADAVDGDRLIKQFEELVSSRARLPLTMADRNAANVRSLEKQFSALSALLLPTGHPAHAMADNKGPG